MSGYYRKFKYTVKLACGCFDLDPRKNGDHNCIFHGIQEIVGHFGKEWHVRCVDCTRLNRWAGQDRTYADRLASRHLPTHRVAVLYDSLERPETVAKLRAMMYPEIEQLPPSYGEAYDGPPPY